VNEEGHNISSQVYRPVELPYFICQTCSAGRTHCTGCTCKSQPGPKDKILVLYGVTLRPENSDVVSRSARDQGF
jgi:hypothetical protein